MTTTSRLAATVAALALLVGACVPSDPNADGSDPSGAPDATAMATDDTASEAGGSEGSDSPDTSAAGATMRIGTTADVVNLNPLVGNSRTDTWVTNLMYPRMMELDLEGTKVPSLATDWSYSDDGLTASVTLRDDFTWSDGEALTADDVIFTIDAIAAEPFGVVGGMLGAYESAEKISDTEIAFTLSQPDGAFLNSIGFWMPIVPEHVFSQADNIQEFANDADWVSAGPYILTEIQQGDRYVMKASDTYPFAPDGTPTLDQVVFRVYPDVNSEVLALRNGDIDVIGNVIPPTLVEELQSSSDIEMVQVPSLGWAHMQYNMRREPLDQLEVRRRWPTPWTTRRSARWSCGARPSRRVQAC